MRSNELFPLKSEQPRPIDFKRILLRYLKFWYLFVICAGIAMSVAFLYLRYYTVPKYVISSTLLIKDQKSSGDAATAAFSDLNLFKSAKNIDNEIEVIRSSSLMHRVVEELDLVTSYHVEGRFQDVEVYGDWVPIKIILSRVDPKAYGKQIAVHLTNSNSFQLEEDNGKLSTHKFGQQINKSWGTFTITATSGVNTLNVTTPSKFLIRFHDIRDVANDYNAALSVYPVNETSSVLSLNLTVTIPEKGKDILNKLVDVYNKEAAEDKNIIASHTIDFIDERLNYLTTELSGVEKNVEVYKSEHEVTDVTTQASNYLEQASNYNKQLSEWGTQIEVLESIEQYLQQNANRMVPSSLGIQDATLLGLINKFNELQLERERMLLTIQPSNPLIQNINDQLSNLKVNILENLRNIKNGLKITSNNLKASSGQFQSRIRQVPMMERELLEINRQQSIKQNLYLYLLQKREEAALSLAASVATSRIIDPAYGGDYPVSPSKSTIYLMAIVLGLGIPFLFLYIRDLMNDKVQVQQDIEDFTKTPILGELIHSKNTDTVVVTRTNKSPIVEMFRLIRANLYFAAVNKENKVLLVTSSMTGEGKTFFSINLGASFAHAGKKVIVLELDLRKPRLTKDLGMTEGVGITNYLISNKLGIDEIIRPTEKVPGMYIISAGPIPPNPSELMLNPKLGHLINELKESFDHIIIDSAPIGQVADAFSLSSFIDSTIYVVRYNYTVKKQLQIIDNIYKNKTMNHPMLVLNAAKESNGSNYGYGYGYGYEEQSKRSKKKKLIK